MVSWVLSGSSPTITPVDTHTGNYVIWKSGNLLQSQKPRSLQRHLPGDPANIENGGTTVSGGNTELSKILQQSFRMQERDCVGERKKKQLAFLLSSYGVQESYSQGLRTWLLASSRGLHPDFFSMAV